ncbi:MAG TPA: Hsp20/alpha crystallin family protein [Candidatus Dormibacteraeota bacterium]|nr:Hsp20/alpha crystallin family protein [Candidatus Dormibacteraeota bacterium]
MALNWSEVDQLFTNAGYGRTHMAEHVVPNLPLDIRQTDEAFWIEASVPGFKPEDVEITLDENLLTIRGTPRQEDGAPRGRYVRRERQLSSVYRQVGLAAEVKAEEITASFENGVLSVMVPRAKKAQPKRIPVTMAGGEQAKVIDAPAGATSAGALP